MPNEGLFVGIIPDGDRRYAGYDQKLYNQSYQKGSKVVGEILRWCINDERIKILAVWGLSDQNIAERTQEELAILYTVFCTYLDKLQAKLQEQDYAGVKVVHLGDSKLLPENVQEKLSTVIDSTKERTSIVLALCLAYGPGDEINRAVGLAQKNLPQDWREFLDLPHRADMSFQPVDAIIRTGADPLRPYTSAFLQGYQGSGTQMRFPSILFPAFTTHEFALFIDDIVANPLRHGK